MKRKIPKKFQLGISFLVTGVIFVVVNWYLYNYQHFYFPIMLFTGILSLFLGLGFTLFPGAHLEEDDPNQFLNPNQFLKYKFKNTPLIVKLIWLAFLALGVVVVFLVIDHYHLKIA